MLFRIALAVMLVASVGVLTLAYRRRRSTYTGEPSVIPDGTPPVPADLLAGAERTWLVFTTPFCASCEPVEAQLRVADPSARIVRIDATRDHQLADDFDIRSAPTALLADGGGRIEAKLVGAPAVTRYVAGRRP